jgi:predicted RNA-binding protein YlxR (DUF448 family)
MKVPKEKLITEKTKRRCISSGETCHKSDMIRFVVDPNKEILPDISEKLPGRGIWVKTNRVFLEKAISKKLFLKTAKEKVSVRNDLLTLVEALLLKNVIALISLSRKSGIAVSGFEKVKSTLTDGSAKALIQARDGSVGQKSKLRPPVGGNSYIDCLSSQELGLAFGRNYVVHASLTSGGLSKRVVHEASRLNEIRGFEPLNKELSANAGLN